MATTDFHYSKPGDRKISWQSCMFNSLADDRRKISLATDRSSSRCRD